MSALVLCLNADGTYDLDVRPHANLENISPDPNAAVKVQWPAGTYCAYYSKSANESWLPAVVTCYNDEDRTYDLDVRDHAHVDFIRARLADRPLPVGAPGNAGDPTDPHASQSPGRGGYADRDQSRALDKKVTRDIRPLDRKATREIPPPPPPQRKNTRDGDFGQYREGSAANPLRLHELENGATYMPQGDGLMSSLTRSRETFVGLYCHCLDFPDRVHIIRGFDDRSGAYTTSDGNREYTVRPERLRAPDKQERAWPTGTKVMYESSSVGQWIRAEVKTFSQGKYHLDVREGANPEKVRPR